MYTEAYPNVIEGGNYFFVIQFNIGVIINRNEN